MKLGIVAGTVCIAIGLGGCRSVNVTCTIATEQRSNVMARLAQTYDLASSEVVAISGYISSEEADLSAINAAALTIDVSQSSVTFPAVGSVTLSIVSNTGVVLASRPFSWVRNGNILSPSNPGEINAWLHTSGASPATSRLRYSLDDVVVSASPGMNSVSTTVKVDDQSVANAAMTFVGPRCNKDGRCRQPDW